ncbi:MAG: uroporphyrinogen decarboxylase family protein [Thermodesulfobacteriota bacterium]
MPEYTGRDHVKAAFKRTFTDRVPCYPIIGLGGLAWFGVKPREFLKDPKTLAETTIRYYEQFNPDIAVLMTDLLMEAEAIGTEVEFPEDTGVQVRKYVLEDKANLSKLKVPDVEKDARFPYYLEGLQRVMDVIKDAPVSANCVGPWSIAGNLRALDTLILDTFDDPDWVHELMKFTTEVVKQVTSAIKDVGAGLGFSEAACSCSVISPAVYKNFIKPYHSDLVNYFKERKAGLTLHICGYIDPIMEDLVEVGLAGLSIDAPSSLEKMMEIAQRRVVVIGNVDVKILAEGKKEDVEREVKRCIDTAAKYSAYILSTSCEVSPGTPMENVENMMKVAKEYGQYKNLDIEVPQP